MMKILKKAIKIYNELKKQNIDVLLDDMLMKICQINLKNMT